MHQEERRRRTLRDLARPEFKLDVGPSSAHRGGKAVSCSAMHHGGALWPVLDCANSILNVPRWDLLLHHRESHHQLRRGSAETDRFTDCL